MVGWCFFKGEEERENEGEKGCVMCVVLGEREKEIKKEKSRVACGVCQKTQKQKPKKSKKQVGKGQKRGFEWR